MYNSKQRFNRRKIRVRNRIASISDRCRLSVFKSNNHIYIQIIDDKIGRTLASASSLEKEIRNSKYSNCNITIAQKLGGIIAERAKAVGVKEVVFDKGGYKYHGVIKALADAARSELNF